MATKSKNVIDIPEFRLDQMPTNSKIVIIGKPATGKSTLIRDIIKTFRHLIPVAKIFCESDKYNHFYSNMFHDLYVIDDYSEDEMEKFVKRQLVAMQNNPESEPYKNRNNPLSKAMLVLDDCSDDPKFFNRPLFQKCMKNGRHWDMMLLLGLQYSMDIRPAIRATIDYVFIYQDHVEKNRKSLYDNYATVVGSYQDFCDVMDQVTGDYTALVIDNREQETGHAKFYYYKAKMHNDFKFGCTEYQQSAEQRYNTKYVPPVV